jgi:hypothetical protein
MTNKYKVFKRARLIDGMVKDNKLEVFADSDTYKK